MLCDYIELVVFVAVFGMVEDVDCIVMGWDREWRAQRLMMDDEAHVCLRRWRSLRGSGRLPASFAFPRGTGQWRVGVGQLRTHMCGKLERCLLVFFKATLISKETG